MTKFIERIGEALNVASAVIEEIKTHLGVEVQVSTFPTPDRVNLPSQICAIARMVAYI